MAHHTFSQRMGGDGQQRPFSFQVPSENSHAQHSPINEQPQPAPAITSQPPSSFSQGWSGYPEQRFSYQDTPIDDNTQTFDDERQASLLEEARQKYGGGQSQSAQDAPVMQAHNQAPPAHSSQYPPEKQRVQRIPSAYQLAPPAEPHPAHHAVQSHAPPPVPTSTLPPPPPPQAVPSHEHYASPPPHSPGPLPLKSEADFRSAAPTSPPPPASISNTNTSIPSTYSTPATFSTYSTNIPDLDSQHRPGQISHPSMKYSKSGNAATPETGSSHHFRYGLCSCPGSDVSTCMTGLFCPCILYSRVTYRLGQKSRKQDPTDVLGFHKCNGHCFAFATLCACGISGFLAGIARGRVRHAYDVDGDAGSDCIEGCCCCCCTVIQSEREIRLREEQRSRWAGPSTVVDLDPYKRAESMRFSSATRT